MKTTNMAVKFTSVVSFGLFSLIFCYRGEAQVYTNKPVGKKNVDLVDSLKKTDYPYSLPILGEKAAKKGYDLPYSAGLSVQYIAQESELVIENLQVGFNYNEPYDLSEVVRFNGAQSRTQAFNFRPDVWLLPFLNVYGILATSKPNTLVDFGIYVPD